MSDHRDYNTANSTDSLEKESLESEAISEFDDQDNNGGDAPSDLITITDTGEQGPVSFHDIIPAGSLRDAVDALGFEQPTPVQASAIPHALTSRDLVIQAKTGSGKTLAYAVPLLAALQRALQEGNVQETYALVLTPTRELALQVAEVISSLDPSTRPVTLIGGTDIATNRGELKSGGAIVVGTPGRVLDCLRQRVLKLNRCRFFVLDEADEMLSIGFLEDVRAILSRLPDRRQGLFVSATLTPRVDMLAHSFLSNPLRLLMPASGKDAAPITHLYCEVGGDLMAKPTALCDIIETQRPSSAIIFCNTKSDTHLVEVLLRRRGFDARRINSELTQRQRTAVMNKLRAKELRFLVATDIAARGIDVSQIDLVINFSIHEQPEVYIHRTGRTGRAGRQGTAISLVGPRDFGFFHYLTKVTKLDFQRLTLPSEEDVAGARVAHLYEIIRQASLEVKPRDTLTARKLLAELGGISEPAEELEAMVAKLTRYALEHHIAEEAKSLDEERELEIRPERSSSDDGEGRKRGRKRKRDREHGEEERDEERRRDERRGEGEHRARRHDDERRGERGRDRGHRHGEDERRERHEEQERPRQPDELRLYIGQGTAEGMTPQLFRDLALEMAELSPQDLGHLTIREHYGYVDVKEPEARKLIASLNGIQYNGALLPVEFAANLAARGNDGHGRRRHGGHDRRGRRGEGERRERHRGGRGR